MSREPLYFFERERLGPYNQRRFIDFFFNLQPIHLSLQIDSQLVSEFGANSPLSLHVLLSVY